MTDTCLYIPLPVCPVWRALGWGIKDIIGGSHGLWSALAVWHEPTWRDTVEPCRRTSGVAKISCRGEGAHYDR